MKLMQTEMAENQFILRLDFCISCVCNSVRRYTIMKYHTHTCFPRGDLGSDAVSACRHLISVCKFSKYPCSSLISFSRTTCKKRHFMFFMFCVPCIMDQVANEYQQDVTLQYFLFPVCQYLNMFRAWSCPSSGGHKVSCTCSIWWGNRV
jgi:hypothetical protein